MVKTELSRFDNSWYHTKAGPVKRILWYYINEILFKSAFFPFYGIKVRVLRVFGAKVGKGVIIKPHVNIKSPWRLEIGNYTWIGEKVWIDNQADIFIGDNVCISQGAMLLTGNHDYKKSTFDLIIGDIHIEEGAWVGAQSVVCPGVTLKSHAILSVGSIATKTLEAYSIYQGNPAIKVRNREIQS